MNRKSVSALWNMGLFFGFVGSLVALLGLNRDRIAYRNYIDKLEQRVDNYETISPIKNVDPVTLEGEADFMIAEMRAKQRKKGRINYYLLGFSGLIVASISSGRLIASARKETKNVAEQVAASDR